MRNKFLIWNDWSVNDYNTIDEQYGDILAAGAWGKIVMFNEKTVVKMPINPHYCMDFANEHDILREIKSVKNPIINVLSTELNVAIYNSDERIRGKVELIKQKYVYGSDINLNASCIFFMQRIYPPKIENLLLLTTNEKQQDLHNYHNMVKRPYYIFIGRIAQWSISGRSNRNTDIGTLSLSDMNGVLPDINLQTNITKNIINNYAGSGIVVANYAVEPGSFPYNVGKSMCKYIWDVFIKKHIILYDTEFVYGQVSGQTKVFIIDCNLCKKIHTALGNVIKTELVNHFAAAMDIRLSSVSPEHWGGFLPNPLITPNFAIECLNNMVNTNDNFDILLLHANFMISFFEKLSMHLTNYDNKGVISTYEKDIKHVVLHTNILFLVDIVKFKLLPEDHDDAVGMENHVKKINKQLNDIHTYFVVSYSKSYLLEISLAIGKEIYKNLLTNDNIRFLDSIVSARISYWLLNPHFSLSNVSSLFVPITEDEIKFYNPKQEIFAEPSDKKYKPTTNSFSLFGEIE